MKTNEVDVERPSKPVSPSTHPRRNDSHIGRPVEPKLQRLARVSAEFRKIQTPDCPEMEGLARSHQKHVGRSVEKVSNLK